MLLALGQRRAPNQEGREDFQEKIEGLFSRERGNQSGASKNTTAHCTGFGQRHLKTSWVPWGHGTEGVSIRVTLLPHLFLTSALRERKWSEDPGKGPDSRPPWGWHPVVGPRGRVSSGLCGAHAGNSMGRGIEWHFPARNCSRVLNVRCMPNRVFSPTLHIQLRSECLSHIVNIFQECWEKGNCYLVAFLERITWERE